MKRASSSAGGRRVVCECCCEYEYDGRGPCAEDVFRAGVLRVRGCLEGHRGWLVPLLVSYRS